MEGEQGERERQDDGKKWQVAWAVVHSPMDMLLVGGRKGGGRAGARTRLKRSNASFCCVFEAECAYKDARSFMPS